MSHKKVKYVSLLLPGLLLAACNTGAIEAPEVVIEKMLTRDPAEIYQSSYVADVTFSVPDMMEYEAEASIGRRVDQTEKKPTHETSLSFDFDMEVTEAFSEEANMAPYEAFSYITMNMAGTVSEMDGDLYGALETFEIDTDVQDFEEVKPMMDFFIQPYTNKVVFVGSEPLDELRALIVETLEDEEPEMLLFIEQLEAYLLDGGIYEDLAASEMLVVNEDLGIESIEALNGEMVDAYHYKMGVDMSKAQAMFELLVNRFDVIEEELTDSDFEEIEAFFESHDDNATESPLILTEGVINLMDIDVWIGQSDYMIYKAEVEFDSEMIENLMKTVAEFDPNIDEDDLNEALEIFGDEFTFEETLTYQRAPLKSVELEKPSEDDLIDMTGLTELLVEDIKSDIEWQREWEAENSYTAPNPISNDVDISSEGASFFIEGTPPTVTAPGRIEANPFF